MNKFKDRFLNKTACIVYGICAGVGIIYGLLRGPFYLHFLDGLTISGFFALGAALIRASWLAGDFTFFSWHPKKRSRNLYSRYEEDPTRGMSYREYRDTIRNERKDLRNDLLPSSLLVLGIALILSFLY